MAEDTMCSVFIYKYVLICLCACVLAKEVLSIYLTFSPFLQTLSTGHTKLYCFSNFQLSVSITICNGEAELSFLIHTCCQTHFLDKSLAKGDESERLSVSSKGRCTSSRKALKCLSEQKSGLQAPCFRCFNTHSI